MIGHQSRFRENDDLLLWRGPAVKKKPPFSNARQSRSHSLVPLDQRSENESSGSNHFEITKEISEFCPSGFTQSASVAHWRMPEMVAPRALDSCRKPEGSWALGTRMNARTLIKRKIMRSRDAQCDTGE